MKEIDDQLKIIDRFSKALDLPVIRRYITFEIKENINIYNYLDSLGYMKVIVSNCDHLYISPSGKMNISMYSKNVSKYDESMNRFSNMTNEEILDMSDEEFELLVRLKG